jgi:hypothetical protein
MRKIIRSSGRAKSVPSHVHDQALPQSSASAHHSSDNASTGTQAAGDLADGCVWMWHAVKAPVREEKVDATVCKWDPLRVALDEVDLTKP